MLAAFKPRSCSELQRQLWVYEPSLAGQLRPAQIQPIVRRLSADGWLGTCEALVADSAVETDDLRHRTRWSRPVAVYACLNGRGRSVTPDAHLPWAKNFPSNGSLAFRRLSMFSTTWGICFRSDCIPNRVNR